MVGQKIRPLPKPVQGPCARKSCQYFVEREVVKTPKSWSRDPSRRVGRESP